MLNEPLSVPTNAKKRGRPRKSAIDLNQTEEFSTIGEAERNMPNTTHTNVDVCESTEPQIIPKSKNTRKSLIETNTDDFNPRLLLIKKRTQLYTDEVLTVPKHEQGIGEQQCGLCLKRSTKKDWQSHLAEHYGIGWVLGNEEPLTLTNRKTVLAISFAYFKNANPPSLLCRICQRPFRSSLGLIQHLENCGEAPKRITCSSCGNNFTKLSLAVHQRGCNNSKQQQQQQTNKESETTNLEGRQARVSSIKANEKLKAQIDENVQSESNFVPKKFVKRLENTLDSKIVFACRICGEGKNFKSKFQAIQHVLSQHKPTADENKFSEAPQPDGSCTDDSDFNGGGTDNCEVVVVKKENTFELNSSEPESDCGNSSKRKRNDSLADINNKVQSQGPKIYATRCSKVSELTHKLWQNFIQENYQNTRLFTNVRPTSAAIANDSFEKLLPDESTSMKFNCVNKLKRSTIKPGESATLEWQTLKRFEDAKTTNNLDKYVYVGAPIKYLQWIPLPPDISEQYLVLAYRKSSKTSSYARLLHAKVHKALLLVYKLDSDLQTIKLHYGFLLDDGPVHTFAFLPSGGYDAATNRLSLIAVGGAQSNIRVYAMPIEPPTITHHNSKISILKLPIAFELVLHTHSPNVVENDDIGAQCLQISWSEFLGHKHIFATYSNGAIAVWYIDEPNSGDGVLNTSFYDESETGKRCYIPQNYFCSEDSRPNGLLIHYDTCGPRWLLTTSISRNLCVFDLRDKYHPVVTMSEYLKHFPRCIDWSPIWETFAVGSCDIVSNYGRVLTMHNPVGVTFSHMNLLHSSSGMACVHYNSWQNLIIVATDNGDLFCVESSELNLDLKHPKKSVALSMLEVKRCNDANIGESFDGDQLQPASFPIIDKASREQENSYGIVFGTFMQLKDNDLKLIRNDKQKLPPHLERHVRINTVRWNLNVKGQDLLAVGYENGFLRFSKFQSKTYFK